MSGEARLRVGYVLKRFPRASETFIAREILELERRGAGVVVLALRPTDTDVRHEWLSSIKAPVMVCDRTSVSQAWRELRKRVRKRPELQPGVHGALVDAFEHPVRSGRRYLAEASWVADRVEELGIQHLHAHFANHPAFVAMLAHEIVGVPFSFTAHAKDIFSAGPTPELWRRQMSEAAFAVTVCEANRDHLASALGPELLNRLRLLYNGVDLEGFAPAPAEGSAAGGPLEVLFVGRLVEKKGADVLLQALATLRERGVPVRLTLVGDGPEAERCRRLAADLELGEHCRFVPLLPHEEVRRRMLRADVFALPCRVAADGDRDALPTVLLEALACGLPCVSTPVNGVAEIVAEGETGLLVPENDADGLARALERLAREPELRRRMGRRGRRRAKRLFDARRNVGRLHDWMMDAVRSSIAGGPGGATVLPMRESR